MWRSARIENFHIFKIVSESYLDELIKLALKNNTDLAKATTNAFKNKHQPCKSHDKYKKALAQAGVLEAILIPATFIFLKASKTILCMLNLRAVK